MSSIIRSLIRTNLISRKVPNNYNSMTSYYIYARKSTESEDRQALSIESQINELRQLAQKDNLLIKKVFTESKSAKNTGRPVFSLMLNEIKKSKSAGILCWKLDRLTRNLLDGAIISDLMEKGTIEDIRTPMQVYRNNSVDRLMSGIDMLFARKYVDDLSDNVIRGLNTKVKMGWMPCSAPTGYISDNGEKGSKKIIPDPKRFKLVRKMWDLMLSGNYSVNQITDIANQQWGFKSRKTKRNGGVPLPKCTLYNLFTNPFYYGYFSYRGELHKGKHKPMVTVSEFEQVQYLLGIRSKPKPERHISTFAGLFRCGLCGAMITAENKIKFVKSNNRTKKYTYYHCTYTKDRNCPRQAITEEYLSQQVVEYLKLISLPEEYLNWIFKYYESVQMKEQQKIEFEKQTIKKEIRLIDKKLQNLLDLKISPEIEKYRLISDIEYVEQKNRLTKKRVVLENSLANYDKTDESIMKLTKETFRLSAYAQKWFQFGDIEQKRTIVKKIYRNRLITNKKVLMSAKKPFEIISQFDFPSSVPKQHIGTDNFGLDKGKYTHFEDTIMNWSPKLDELGTEIRKITKYE